MSDRINIKTILTIFIVILALASSIVLIVKNVNKEEKEPVGYIRNLINSYKVLKVENSEINFNAEYPYFSYEKLDEEIKDIVKEEANTTVTYEINSANQIYNILFTINNNGKKTYKNVVLDLKTEELTDKNAIYDFNTFGTELLNRIKNKYRTSIYSAVLTDNFNSASVNIEKNGIRVLFNDSLFNVNYDVDMIVGEEVEAASTKYDKVIAFTFDDGPSSYTKEIVNTLNEYNSSATFFELGSKMKENQDIVNYLISNNMEVASHTYSHKNLNASTIKAIEEEINSTNIIHKEITGKDVPLTRTPYGNAVDKVKNIINTPIINWSVDTKDWQNRDANKISKHIIENAKDGDIILMHDIYPETVEAIKIVLPELINNGFKITNVTDLAKEKNAILEKHEVYSSFETKE